MEWKRLYGLHNGRLDTEVDSKQIDTNLLCLLSGALGAGTTWPCEAYSLALRHVLLF